MAQPSVSLPEDMLVFTSVFAFFFNALLGSMLLSQHYAGTGLGHQLIIVICLQMSLLYNLAYPRTDSGQWFLKQGCYGNLNIMKKNRCFTFLMFIVQKQGKSFCRRSLWRKQRLSVLADNVQDDFQLVLVKYQAIHITQSKTHS